MNLEFLGQLQSIAQSLNEIITSSQRISIFSHWDADGICAAALLVKLLLEKHKIFKVHFLRQLEEDKLGKLRDEPCDLLILLDFGSGQLHKPIFREILHERKVVIIDHHQVKEQLEMQRLYHINPYILGASGEEISAAGLMYFIGKYLNPKLVRSAYLALVGAYGDRQERKEGFVGFNKYILQDAESNKVIEIKHGLRIFGRLSKPLHKAIEQCTSIFIPGVSGNESGAVQFLSELGIKLKDEEGNWRRLCDLSLDEEMKLVTGIILQRLENLSNPADVFGNIYEIKGKEDMLSDVYEFSTLLNACGRLGEASIGLSLCLGDRKYLETSKRLLQTYRRSIWNALEFVYENLESNEVYVQEERFTAVIGGDKIPYNLTSTITSLILNSTAFPTKEIVVVFAKMQEAVKVSVRSRSKSYNIGKLVREVAEEIGGEGGGHLRAGGAKIQCGKEHEFIQKFKEKLEASK